MPQTPPATQVPPRLTEQGEQGMSSSPTRHPEFYYTDPTLTDPIVLQVCCYPSISFCIVVTPIRPKIPYTGFPSSILRKEATSSRRLFHFKTTTRRMGFPTIFQLSSLRLSPAQRLMCTYAMTKCESNPFEMYIPGILMGASQSAVMSRILRKKL